jgi:hypothetical protein
MQKRPFPEPHTSSDEVVDLTRSPVAIGVDCVLDTLVAFVPEVFVAAFVVFAAASVVFVAQAVLVGFD